MPPGTPFSSLIPPYSNIRVDLFTDATANGKPPALHLLTHTHSDHIVGLSSKSFAQPIVCSPDAKEMLLRHELYKERALFDGGVDGNLPRSQAEENTYQYRVERVRTFKHLKVDPVRTSTGHLDYTWSRDLLQAIPLNTPTEFTLSATETVTITLIDANHCPGAVMCLIEGTRGAVLHTGDVRAEPRFIEALELNPHLRPYLASTNERSLEAIFLDTACLLSTANVPSKKYATDGLVSLMKLYPYSTRFFVNAWTWGYEDVLKAIADEFRTQAFSISGAKHQIVYINPVSMDKHSWEAYQVETRSRIESGERVECLLVPLSRHSPLPELQSLVRLFKPKKLHPNTLDPSLGGLDWLAMREMFKGCISGNILDIGPLQSVSSSNDAPGVLDVSKQRRDATLENLMGDGSDDVARRWAEDGNGNASGRMKRQLNVLRRYIPPDVLRKFGVTGESLYDRRKATLGVGAEIMESQQGGSRNPILRPEEDQEQQNGREVIVIDDSGDENAASPCNLPALPRTPDPPARSRWKGKGKASSPFLPISPLDEETQRSFDEDDRGRTAHFLFAPISGIASPEARKLGNGLGLDLNVGHQSDSQISLSEEQLVIPTELRGRTANDQVTPPPHRLPSPVVDQEQLLTPQTSPLHRGRIYKPKLRTNVQAIVRFEQAVGLPPPPLFKSIQGENNPLPHSHPADSIASQHMSPLSLLEPISFPLLDINNVYPIPATPKKQPIPSTSSNSPQSTLPSSIPHSLKRTLPDTSEDDTRQTEEREQERKRRKLEMKEERYAIADRLARACPSLSTPEFRERQARRERRKIKKMVQDEYKDGWERFYENMAVYDEGELEHRDGNETSDVLNNERTKEFIRGIKDSVVTGQRIRLPRICMR
ncbi:hypothetical protein EYR40_010966 [Pleurotus pulmonarius]|nr:hypothetical protein EYR36_002734 [Pleurotus pulmonarius]KAF4586949.1 hypothetical protein EYR40_010966 [Pleurotus pulmonarius]